MFDPYLPEFYHCTKMKFSIKDFYSKYDQIHSFLRIWSHLLRKSFMENVIFCAVYGQKSLSKFYCLPNVSNRCTFRTSSNVCNRVSPSKLINGFNTLTINVPHHIETTLLFASQTNWLVSIWYGTVVANGSKLLTVFAKNHYQKCVTRSKIRLQKI